MTRELARAKEGVARLRAAPETADEVFAAFAELDALPADVVREALEAWLGPAPDVDRLDDAMRRALRLPARKPRLVTLSVAHDADVLDLGALAEEQLRVAGRSWDGADLAAEERLDGEVEGTFAGTLERRVLGEAASAPMLDVVRFLGDAGVVFRAGTVERVGLIVDGRVEVRDPTLRAALEEALAGRAEAAPEEREAAPAAHDEADAAPAKKPRRAPAKTPTKTAVKKTPKKATASSRSRTTKGS